MKIGNLPLETLPIVGTDLDPTLVDQHIALDLWEALTVNEQRDLIQHLKQQHAVRFRSRLAALSVELNSGATEIKADLVDRDLADSLHRGLSALSTSLRKAGHGRSGMKRTTLLSSQATSSIGSLALKQDSVSSDDSHREQ